MYQQIIGNDKTMTRETTPAATNVFPKMDENFENNINDMNTYSYPSQD